ncbi:hypothetical protein [Aliikangiella sp. IMCC44359]|uniref:hypothetical protein n=1 Tax=Aliikangiella sp. IMCC44359 TaxID=3459125 RepID=UPI00403A9337
MKIKFLDNMKAQNKERIAIAMIGILIFYHILKLYNFTLGNDLYSTSDFLNSFNKDFPVSFVMIMQNIFRGIIIVSLVTIFLKRKEGLVGMWAGIIALVTLQFILASSSNHEMIQTLYSDLKPLKGIIFPTFITFFYQYIGYKKQNQLNELKTY